MTELKIYSREEVITHTLGDEFNDELEAFIATLVMCDCHIEVWHSGQIHTLGGHYIISANIKDKSFNLAFKVNAKQELQSFEVFDFDKHKTIYDDIFNYLYKKI